MFFSTVVVESYSFAQTQLESNEALENKGGWVVYRVAYEGITQGICEMKSLVGKIQKDRCAD